MARPQSPLPAQARALEHMGSGGRARTDASALSPLAAPPPVPTVFGRTNRVGLVEFHWDGDQHSMLRRIEFVSGLATSVAGLLGWAYAVFGPTYRYMGSAVSSGGRTSIVSGSISVAQKGLGPNGTIFFVAMLLIVASFAAIAYLHSQRGVGGALTLLWTLTSLLCILAVLGAASVGVLLLPAALLAIVTSVTGSLARR